MTPLSEKTFGKRSKLRLGNLRLLKDILPAEFAKQELCCKRVPKQELGNQPFMFQRNTQDHETGGTGFLSCAWTPEGGCPTLSEQKSFG
jgi:hypothetical protein